MSRSTVFSSLASQGVDATEFDVLDGGLSKSDVGLGNVDNVADASQTSLGIVTTGTLGSNVVFPVGHVLQVKRGTYKTETTVGSSAVKIIEVDLTALGANSWYFATWQVFAGVYLDSEGFRLYATLSTATADVTDATQEWDKASSGEDNQIFGNDIGNNANGNNAYAIDAYSGDLDKHSGFAKGATVHCSFWAKGGSTMYINRSSNRTGAQEAGITSLVVMEVAE